MTRFRPCIDLHAGQVKQIVGGTLDTANVAALQTNFVATQPPAYYAKLYRDNGLVGAHVIMLGGGNEDAAKEAVTAWPSGAAGDDGAYSRGGLQVGGGIRDTNAASWISAGADKVIVTSYLFAKDETTGEYTFRQDRLDAVLTALGGDASRLVIDLSCRRRRQNEVAAQAGNTTSASEDQKKASASEDQKSEPQWVVAINKWQTLTDMVLSAETMARLAPYCSEFLVHAADVEGLQGGMDSELVSALAKWCRPLGRPVTYAGGARHLDDLALVERLSGGWVDLTIGSALDCFGGTGVKLADCIAWNQKKDSEEKATTAA